LTYIHDRIARVMVTLAATCLLAALAVGHTGSGIAVDSLGQVYFLDTGSGLWKIDSQGKLTKLSGTMYHWLAIDVNNRFAQIRLPSGSLGEISVVGSSPALLLSSDYPIAVSRDGVLYYPTGRPGYLRLTKMLPSGETSVFARLPATARGPLPHINGICTRPDGSVYYTEDHAIRRITSQGVISTVATVPALAGGQSIPGVPESAGPLLRGLAVDARGVIYVAANGDGRVLKITPEGVSTTLVQTQGPWSPTAVAISGNVVYVLEFLHTARDVRRDWLPRVRKITPDGKSTIIATITR
jgi:DNA-binding beta-propeller fold protein YncE